MNIEIHRFDQQRVAAIRLSPNTDLVDGIQQAMARCGFEHAVVRTGLGSLIDAVVLTPDGARRLLSGPAIEILVLTGEVAIDPHQRVDGISAILGTITGEIVAGKLAAGENPICVTVECVLEEIRIHA